MNRYTVMACWDYGIMNKEIKNIKKILLETLKIIQLSKEKLNVNKSGKRGSSF